MSERFLATFNCLFLFVNKMAVGEKGRGEGGGRRAFVGNMFVSIILKA